MVKKNVLFLAIALVFCFAACNTDEPSSGSGTVNYPEGAIKGVFSVGENKKVAFSKGNLWMQTSLLTHESMWKFAENQYDTIGRAQSLWKEFFSWNEIVASTSFTDWKNSSIINGNKGNTTWRVLSAEEWLYLFRTRKNAEKLFAFGKVEGVNGLIILPDNWDNTKKHVNFATENGMSWDVVSYRAAQPGVPSYESNPDYSTATQWKDLADLGAVFLPAAGYNDEGEKYRVNEYGFYLTPTTDDDDCCVLLVFYGLLNSINYSYIDPDRAAGYSKDVGNSIRLVTDIK